MDILAQVTRDRENLVEGLQQMQQQYEELGRRLQQQSGACQYVEMLLERIRGERNGATPGVEAAPVEGELG